MEPTRHIPSERVTYEPSEIRALAESSRNRGLLHAIARFGDGGQQAAARQKLSEWNRTSHSDDAA